jgi:hypothetical protein
LQKEVKKAIQLLIIMFPIKKTPGQDGCNGEFYQVFMDKVIQILSIFFPRMEGQGILPNSFCKTRITMKSDKGITRKEKT